MNLTDCPRFDKCSAPVCPIDPKRLLRKHIKGEAVCFYLLEGAKPLARAVLEATTAPELLDAIMGATPSIIARYGPIRRALYRAARNPPRIGRKVGVVKNGT